MRLQSIATFGGALGLLPLSLWGPPTGAAGGAVSLAGTGAETVGAEVAWWFSISATGAPWAEPAGYAAYCAGFSDPQQTCVDGPVIMLVPPTGGTDYWCVTSQVSNHDSTPPDPNEVDYNAILLYREATDTGAKDDVSFMLGPGTNVDCDALPSAPDFRPLQTGQIAAVWV